MGTPRKRRVPVKFTMELWSVESVISIEEYLAIAQEIGESLLASGAASIERVRKQGRDPEGRFRHRVTVHVAEEVTLRRGDKLQ
jgi:hypothetical protein